MPFMRAIQVKAPGADFEIVEKEIPEPGPDQVLIKVEACGICHGDSLTKEGHYPGITYPRTPGHEVVGMIEQVGAGVRNWLPGQRVGVGWHGGPCLHCSACLKGNFEQCENPHVTGLSVDGGYAEHMVAHTRAVTLVPEGLASFDAAPIVCAGRTTFGALSACEAKAGDLVAIHGFGGLGHLAVQYAVKLGFRTVVLSRGKDKEVLARKLGAHDFIDTEAMDAAKELRAMGGARVILCMAPNGKAVTALLGGLAPGGQAILITSPNEPLQVPPHLLLGGGRGIRGWVGGSVGEALRFSVLTHVLPMVEVFPLEQAALAYERMMNAKARFRSVLRMS